jgi:hypothetical protein
MTRRFPPPWTIKEMNDACFIVRDKNGQKLGYFYFEEEEAGRLTAKETPAVHRSRHRQHTWSRRPR